MDPVTINLEGLSEFGPFGYLIGHTLAALFFGIIAFRQTSLAGKCKGEGCQDMVANSHICRAVTGGVLGLANAIVVIVMSVNLFVASLDKANSTTASMTTSKVTLCSPYVITSGDGYQFTIHTLNSLSDHDWQSLRILGSEATRLDRVDALSQFLNRCKIRAIRVTTIVGVGNTMIYDNPENKPVEEIRAIPYVAAGGVEIRENAISRRSWIPCNCGAPFDKDGHCERIIAQFGKEAIENRLSFVSIGHKPSDLMPPLRSMHKENKLDD